MKEFAGRAAIGHVRYATCGATDRSHAQPFERHHGCKWKWFAFAFNGQLANFAELRDDEIVEGLGTLRDDLLTPLAAHLDLWETEYLQILEGEDPVLEWVTATGLRPVLTGLDAGARERFLDEYTRRLRAAYPMRAGGRTLYPFRRLFIVATV